MLKEDVDKMTLQEACDYSVNAIVKQGERCMQPADGGETCAYGDGAGKHCAIGWLLDETDAELMESEMVITDLLHWCYELPNVVVSNEEAMVELQRFHDSALQENRESIRQELAQHIDTETNPSYQKWVDMGDGDL